MSVKLENELIAGYQKDFRQRTGKSIKVTVCSKWEAACQLPLRMELPVVIDMILDANEWNWSEVFTNSRQSKFIFRRGLVYYILVKSGFSFLKVARFTQRDHTTIIYAIRKFEDQLDQEPLTGMLLLEVMDYIQSNYSYYLVGKDKSTDS
jgi:chromosomal replication initiation ATPase DnaA